MSLACLWGLGCIPKDKKKHGSEPPSCSWTFRGMHEERNR
jgi:hypothetical protein